MTNKNMKTSSPAEIVGSIDELLTEFFLRIPLKPLVQLKLVSKRWKSLISDPKLHSSRSKKPFGYLFQNQNPNYFEDQEKALLLSLQRPSPVGPPSITELDIAKKNRKGLGYKIFHSCNGLLVGYRHAYTSSTGRRRSYYNDYFVYNPTTGGKYKSIGSPCVSISLWMYLAFDPSDSPHYNIVCVSRPDVRSDEYLKTGVQQYDFAVYSSKTPSWKKFKGKFRSKFMKIEKGVYWNKSIHWISLSDTEKSIYFSLPHHLDDACGHSLTILEMPTPPILPRDDKSNNYFGESNDHLNFISYYGRDEYRLKVYEMRRDYSEWFVRYNVDVSNVWCRVWNKGLGSFGCPSSFVVCGLVRGKKWDDEDDSSLVLLIKGKMIVYNVATGTFEITSEFDEEEEKKKDQKEKGEENNEVYDKFNAFWSGIKHLTGLYCPLQYIESLYLV